MPYFYYLKYKSDLQNDQHYIQVHVFLTEQLGMDLVAYLTL